MKVLKIIERVLFVLAIVVGGAAIGLSYMFDEGAAQPVQGMATAFTAAFPIGFGLALVILLVGALLVYAPNKVASFIGEGFVAAIMVLMFSFAIVFLGKEPVGFSALLALVAPLLYALAELLRFVAYIVKLVVPSYAAESNNPDNDIRIQNVIKWKNLMEQGIITEEEYSEKRAEILKLRKEQNAKKEVK